MMRKYAERPMDLADASLVWLANRSGVTDIIAIDRADFAVHRTANRKALRNLFVANAGVMNRFNEPSTQYRLSPRLESATTSDQSRPVGMPAARKKRPSA